MYWVLLSFFVFDRLFTWVLLGFPMFHCVESVFLDFSWFYWMFTGLRHVLLGFTKLHSVVLIFIKFWLGSSRFYMVYLGFTRNLIRFTGFHVISWGSLNWLLLNLVRLYWNFTGFNQIFSGFFYVPLGLIEIDVGFIAVFCCIWFYLWFVVLDRVLHFVWSVLGCFFIRIYGVFIGLDRVLLGSTVCLLWKWTRYSPINT